MLEPFERARASLVVAAGFVVAVCWLALVSSPDKPTLLLHNTPQAQTTTTNPQLRPLSHR